MSFPPAHIKPLLVEVATLLRRRKETVAIAETAAGGLISALLLSQPGASSYYAGGVTAYSLPARVQFLGWQQSDIDGYQGPTEPIVLKLAQNARATLSSTWALSESRVAGPTRPTKYADTIGGPGHCPIAVVGPGFEKTRTIETGKTAREENMMLFAERAIEASRDGLIEVEGSKASL